MTQTPGAEHNHKIAEAVRLATEALMAVKKRDGGNFMSLFDADIDRALFALRKARAILTVLPSAPSPTLASEREVEAMARAISSAELWDDELAKRYDWMDDERAVTRNRASAAIDALDALRSRPEADK